MSVEINTNTAIELSNEELDLVAGGAITDIEFGFFHSKQNLFDSSVTTGLGGFTSKTHIEQSDITSFAYKKVVIS
jgi:hypothetical protein